MSHDRAVLEGNQRLLDGVVADTERDHRGTLRRVRDLVDVEVEPLRARCEGGVEGLERPFHLRLREPELLGNGICDRGLVPLPVGGCVVLEPWRIRRAVSRDRQHTVLEQVGLNCRIRARRGLGGRHSQRRARRRCQRDGRRTRHEAEPDHGKHRKNNDLTHHQPTNSSRNGFLFVRPDRTAAATSVSLGKAGWRLPDGFRVRARPCRLADWARQHGTNRPAVLGDSCKKPSARSRSLPQVPPRLSSPDAASSRRIIDPGDHTGSIHGSDCTASCIRPARGNGPPH